MPHVRFLSSLVKYESTNSRMKGSFPRDQGYTVVVSGCISKLGSESNICAFYNYTNAIPFRASI